jgi:uncharacterized protein YcaQ
VRVRKASQPIRLSLDTARALALIKQRLYERPPVVGKQALLESIRAIGLLQLDSIHIVARSHYLVMLSRVGLYDPADLDALLFPDRRLFEQWAHAACLIPMEDYAYFAPTILARRERPLHTWVQQRLGDDSEGALDSVLAEVRERGPLSSRDFKDPRHQRGTWWDWKPAKTALEVLFSWGTLMVEKRVNFQRHYDLAERVLPGSADPPVRTLDDFRHWATLRSVACLGIATALQVSDYYRQGMPDTRATIKSLVAESRLVAADVEGWEDTAYLDPADLPLVEELENGTHRPTLTTFLAPFDNLIWDRQRVRDLFDFDYRAEMYQPVDKRQYGYYVLPILHQGHLVGRLDPKADRKEKTLVIRAIYLEPGYAPTDDLVAGIACALYEFMAFHDSEQLAIERSEPAVLGLMLLERVKAGNSGRV